MSIDFFKNLLRDLGQVIQLPNLTADEDGYCCLSFDEKITVHLQLDKETDNLTFFCEVGVVQEDFKHQLYERMLEANVFWLGTGGATLGMNSENMTATMGYQEPIQGIDFQRFQQLLEGFVNTSEKWIDTLNEIQSGAAPSSDESSSRPPEMGGDFQGIPV